MPKLLKLVGLGILIWGLGLVWPLASELLSPKVADAVVVGLVVALAAYYLGQNFTNQALNCAPESDQLIPEAKAQSTPLSVPIVYPFYRSSHPTRPLPQLLTSDFHKRVTQPVRVTFAQPQHARITEPVPLTR
jgi:hypothetical protein